MGPQAMRPATRDMLGAPEEAPIKAAGARAHGERIATVDNAKAIGIVLVVLGHASGVPPLMAVLVYAFHMPLFFFISGYLLSEARVQEPLSQQLRRLARDLLLPYLLFFALSWAYWLITRDLGNRAAKFAGISWSAPLSGLVSGLGSDLIVNPALWFLPCLFTTLLLYAALRRWLSAGPAAIAGLTSAVLAIQVMNTIDGRLPWGLDIAWVAMAFVAAGCWLRSQTWAQALNPLHWRWPARALAVVLLATVFVSLALHMGRVDLNMTFFGPQPLLYVATAASGIALTTLLASQCPPNRLTTWLSRNTLVIFPSHVLVMNFASGFAQLAFHISPTDLQSPVWMLVSSLLAIAAAAPIGMTLRYLLPQVFDRAASKGRRMKERVCN
ncbi:MAG TPA: acyltransferase family protein [Rhodocyclaceae bacterium]|nr:acyltransferase family protein [Rhodocyclaceae bacterium]